MFILILFLVVGSLLAYVAQYNFTPVPVNLGFYTFFDIPLFYVIVASFIAGLVLSHAFYLIHSIFTSLKFRGKNKEIKKNKDEVLELTKRVHQLEIENEKLKHNPVIKPVDSRAL
jgi:lipopolysaccharide assembly protein A